MAVVHVAKIETDGRTARVILSDGNELHGLISVDSSGEVNALSKFVIEGYIMRVCEMDKKSYS